ncbi:MAG: glycosyltransferase family 4 protein [Chloroflexi bacterium]|nr:glycosyltransferase family 4 protein [Chloroflexota bacterium]
MRLGISTRGLSQGSYAISTIVLHLTRKIIELAGSRHEIFLYHNDPRHAELFASTAFQRGYKLNNRFIWDQVWLPYLLKKDKIDIALFVKGTIPELLPCRGAVIFHDLGYFDDQLRPYLSSDTTYMKIMMPRAAKKASMVFTVSEFTKKESIRLFGLDSNKTRVCYEDCSPIYKPVIDQAERNAIRTRYNLPEKFIFCPTSISPRKNLPRILAAFEMVKDKIPHDLVITGGQSIKEKELVERFDSGFYHRVRVLRHIPYEDMPGLYSLADFALYPSLLEGFGMPVLEAFRTGCPILTSNISSIPEVAGDAAFMVDPYNTDQIADGMLKLAEDSPLRQSLIAKGYEQSKKFSWERTARIILDGLEEVEGIQLYIG